MASANKRFARMYNTTCRSVGCRAISSMLLTVLVFFCRNPFNSDAMEILKGIPVSPGVYIGEAFLQESEEARIPELYVLSELTEDEVKRFEHAADHVVEEIDAIRRQTEDQLGAG